MRRVVHPRIIPFKLAIPRVVSSSCVTLSGGQVDRCAGSCASVHEVQTGGRGERGSKRTARSYPVQEDCHPGNRWISCDIPGRLKRLLIGWFDSLSRIACLFFRSPSLHGLPSYTLLNFHCTG